MIHQQHIEHSQLLHYSLSLLSLLCWTWNKMCLVHAKFKTTSQSRTISEFSFIILSANNQLIINFPLHETNAEILPGFCCLQIIIFISTFSSSVSLSQWSLINTMINKSVFLSSDWWSPQTVGGAPCCSIQSRSRLSGEGGAKHHSGSEGGASVTAGSHCLSACCQSITTEVLTVVPMVTCLLSCRGRSLTPRRPFRRCYGGPRGPKT